jgi:hypothetical protein
MSLREMLPKLDVAAPSNVNAPLPELTEALDPGVTPDEINTDPPSEPDPPSINIAPALLPSMPDPVDKEMSPVNPRSPVLPVVITIDPDTFADDPEDKNKEPDSIFDSVVPTETAPLKPSVLEPP